MNCIKLKYQWPLVWLLIFLIPFKDTLALSQADNTVWQHLLWPLVHANILHWFLNTIAFMALWRIVTPTRLICGYLLSVAIGYLYTAVLPAASAAVLQPALHGLPVAANSSLFTLHSSLALCGISGIIFFLLGIIYLRISRLHRLQLTLAIIASCFIPGIAASVHIISLIAGILYTRIERFTHSTTQYTHCHSSHCISSGNYEL